MYLSVIIKQQVSLTYDYFVIFNRANSLAENSISVDTIFIDEGFGTLSQEWLNSVMAALEKLNSTSGKHVGIISHIEDLQKRITTVIEVRKTNATTSEISIRG